MQVIDTDRSVDTSLLVEFLQPDKSSVGFGFGFRCVLSRKGAFSKDLLRELEDRGNAESFSRKKFQVTAMSCKLELRSSLLRTSVVK